MPCSLSQVFLSLNIEISRSFSPMPLNKHRRHTKIIMEEATVSQPHSEMRAAQGYSFSRLASCSPTNHSYQSTPRNVLDLPTYQEQAIDKLHRASEVFFWEDESRFNHSHFPKFEQLPCSILSCESHSSLFLRMTGVEHMSSIIPISSYSHSLGYLYLQ